MIEMPKQRLHYFDIIKGLAITAVVMGHVLWFSMEAMRDSIPFRLIASIHMPLFFFISGWFITRLDSDGRLVPPQIQKRFIQLIVPTVVMSSLFLIVAPSLHLNDTPFMTFKALWLSSAKYGYWFGIALFELILLYRLSVPMLDRAKKAWQPLAGALIASAVFYIITKRVPGAAPFEPNELANYTIPFIAGATAHRHYAGFMKFIGKNVVMTAALCVLAISLFIIGTPYTLPNLLRLSARIACLLSLAVLSIRLLKPWAENQKESPGIAFRTFTYLGRNSFGIYLLQYFFLFPLQDVENVLSAMLPGFVPLVFISIVAAAAIIAASCLIIEVLRPSRLLSRIVTGQ